MRPSLPLRSDKWNAFGLAIACLLAQFHLLSARAAAQSAPPRPAPAASRPASGGHWSAPDWTRWTGQPIRRIEIEGIRPDRLAPIQARLPIAVGQPLSRDNVAAALRQLYASGLFDSVDVEAEREAGGVALIFRGAVRRFVGTVTVDGAKGATMNTQLERTGRLAPGTRFSDQRLQQAITQMKQLLADDGYHEAQIHYALTPNPAEQLINLAFHVTPGPRARVGTVTVAGDSGMTLEEFRGYAHLRAGEAVDHDTVSRALAGILKHYRKEKRLEAQIQLVSQTYAAHKIDYKFTATRGPVVHVQVNGAKLSQDHIQSLVPIYEEGSVDDDLLNEGSRRIRDYFQGQGYFDVQVEHRQQANDKTSVQILYTVQLGQRRRVESVKVDGNHYFDSATLEDLLRVRAANAFDRHGLYSQALVSADIAAITNVYRNNGFSNVSVTLETGPTAESVANATEQPETAPAASHISAPLTVIYHITEGPQQRVGTVTLTGNEHIDTITLTSLMNTESGQLLSPGNLAGDRDTLMSTYMARGFNDARVEVAERDNPSDPNKVDVLFRIHEGPQTFVRKVFITGLHYTRPSTVANGITLHPGDPLNQQALQQTQRNLYDLALFNEVTTAVQNPNGAEVNKTILLQAVEARRWTLTYGAGFEAQTGTPQNNCAGYLAAGAQCSPNGRTGVSPRVLLSITRNNLFGREQSASVQGTYGLLEQQVNLIYQNPHLFGARRFGLTFTGGYANSQAVTTYVASKLDAGFRLTQNFNSPGGFLSRANTFIYEFDFRRVKVAGDTLQVYPNGIPLLSAAVRVGGPGFTWIRDTRDSPVDAHHGTYTSFQEFLSAAPFGAQAQFNRIDISNSSFWSFDKGKFVLARNTRYGQERAFGDANSELIPLPERLYAGGAASLRGFSTNAAGPRDPQTGYPIGGAGAFVNSIELRLPPPTLPYFGNTVSFVLFHDMGNIFHNSSDIWPSLLRVHQPDKENCEMPQPQVPKDQGGPLDPGGPTYSTGPAGTCSFNYFSHTPGLGVRYHTPVGPIRFDFSYNLNPPIYPVTYDYGDPSLSPHVGEASHFNFFFSLGQTF